MSAKILGGSIVRFYNTSSKLIPEDYLLKFDSFTELSIDEKSKILYEQARRIISNQNSYDKLSDIENLDSLLKRITVPILLNTNPTKTQVHWDKQVKVEIPLLARLSLDQEIINQFLLKHLKKSAVIIGIGSWNGNETFHFLRNIAQIPSSKNLVTGVANIDGNQKATQMALVTSQVLGLNPELFLCYQGNALERLPSLTSKLEVVSQIFIASRFITILNPKQQSIFLQLLRDRMENEDNLAIVTNSIIDLQKSPSKVLVDYLNLVKKGILELEELPGKTGISFIFAQDIPEEKLDKEQVCQTFLYKGLEETFFEIHGFRCLEKSEPKTESDGITRIASVLKASLQKV